MYIAMPRSMNTATETASRMPSVTVTHSSAAQGAA
jgi:hypothetical protein